jgi:NAD(P)-dependent dehydrogenase (short-subunit alcohol dehydrogenase family)
MSKIAVVTGAGSGVGRAVALELAKRQYDVALLGRHEESLLETIKLASNPGGKLLPIVCDVSREQDVRAMAARVRSEVGDPSVLVNSAGVNAVKRALVDLSVEDFKHILDINLTGVFLCIHEFLPAMRRGGSGTIVNINSDAGLSANPISGVSYIAAKFGLTGLTDAINIEERKNGIRACCIFPGEINTPLLEKRPVVPPPEARAKMLQAEDVAAAVMLAIDLPERATVERLLIRPRVR